MKVTYVFYIFLLLAPAFVLGQVNSDVSPCGINNAKDQLFKNYQGLEDLAKQRENKLEDFTNQFIQSRIDDDTLIVPVVFHIIHNYGPENILSSECRDAIDRLNIDFQAENTDLFQVHSDFQDLIPVTNILFRLATIDPDGNCTSGITRTVSPLTDSANDNVKELIGWPPNKYLNVWIVNNIAFEDGGSAAAYAYYPGTADIFPEIDGIVNRYDYFGGNQRTLTHEVGHWINLRHPWGNSNDVGLPSNCSDDDLVSDTPNCIGNTGCNVNFESCGSLDNVQNYMNYSSCDRNFTQGQSNRMRAALSSSIAQRNNLWSPSNLAATGTDVAPSLCTADFYSNVFNGCVGTEVQFLDDSFNGEITSWEWTFEGGTPATSNEKNPIVIFNEGGTHDVSLTVGNGQTTATNTKSNYITIYPEGLPSPYNETFENQEELPNERWIVNSENSVFFELTDQAAVVGTHSAFLRNYIQTFDQKDELISSTVSLSGVEAGELTFKYAYAKKSDANSDILRVWISRNCGETWVQKKQIKASTGDLVTGPNTPSTDFYPTEDQWAEASVNLSSLYYIDNFRFKFQFISGGGNNVFIDDIRVFDPTVGINQINKANLGFQVFPNPVSQDVTLEFNLFETHEVRAELYDLTGRQIDQLFVQPFGVGTHRFVYNASALKPGLYMIRLTLAGESFTTRLVKE